MTLGGKELKAHSDETREAGSNFWFESSSTHTL